MAEIIDREFPVDPQGILPAITPDNSAHWEALEKGILLIQECGGCGRSRFPIAPACPYCGSSDWTWREASGEGTVFSFMRQHKGYLPEFEDLLPYVVATIQLAEGPRMFARLIGVDVQPKIGQPARLVIERWPGGRCVPAFRVTE